MFFVLSKIFWAAAQPVSLVFILVVLGMIFFGLERKRLGFLSAGLGALLLVLCCFTTLGALVIAPLEDRFGRPAEMPEDIDAIVLLGGAVNGRVSTTRGIVELTDSGDRLTEAYRLAQLYPDVPLVVTGGGGQLVSTSEPEATTMERFFVSLGLPRERLLLETASRNTAENAALTAETLGGSDKRILLVTSAFHLPRSMALFRKAGFDAIAWPADYRSAGDEGLEFDLSDPVGNLETATTAIREWIGLVAYRLSGQTDELLASP